MELVTWPRTAADPRHGGAQLIAPNLANLGSRGGVSAMVTTTERGLGWRYQQERAALLAKLIPG
jgi:hypothetical protein